jgi:hypothetical protein
MERRQNGKAVTEQKIGALHEAFLQRMLRNY